MKKKIISLSLIVLLLLTFMGCNNSVPSVEDALPRESSSMFVIVERNTLWNRYYVVYHKETKVMYTVGCDTEFTVMLDADGKPLLYERDLY